MLNQQSKYRNLSADEAISIIKNYFPARPDYDTWIMIISAIGNHFSEADSMYILKACYVEEKPDEIKNKYSSRLKSVNIGTLIYHAKLQGYSAKYNSNVGIDVKNKYTKSYNKPKSNKFQLKMEIKVNNILRRFENERLEEEAAILEYDNGLSRYEAELEIINKYPDEKYEILYRVAINSSITNKNINPITQIPFGDYINYTTYFINYYCSIQELANNILQGNSFMCGHFNSTPEGYCIKKSNNWLGADLFAIDIDKGISISEILSIPEIKDAIMIYTTFNHTENENRFRIIFDLPTYITDANDYQKLINKYITIFKADRQCKDLSRGFYGNTNAYVLIRDAEDNEFKKYVFDSETNFLGEKWR